MLSMRTGLSRFVPRVLSSTSSHSSPIAKIGLGVFIQKRFFNSDIDRKWEALLKDRSGRFSENLGRSSTRLSNSTLGSRLSKILWDKEDEIGKSTYKEHPEIKKLDETVIREFHTTQQITLEGTDIPRPIMDFEHAPFPRSIIELLKSQFSAPTPIQAQSWPVALSGRDMVGVSQTGSGKTLGFILPALASAKEQMEKNPPISSSYAGPSAIVLCPTRELARQITDEAHKFLAPFKLRIGCVYGGDHKYSQTQYIRQYSPQIIVATPGRLIDLLEERVLKLSRCTYLVLDEADRMLDMGFEPQIRSILSQVRPDRQTLMWSATWPKEIRNLASEFFTNPIKITVGSLDLAANPNVQQNVHIIEHPDQKMKLLLNVIENRKGKGKFLIFCQTKSSTETLMDQLYENRIKGIDVIHGDKNQAQRTRTLYNFKTGHTPVLIATDVAARGIDVEDVTDVVNFEFPMAIENYVHRIGRTGRAGRKGSSHTFFDPSPNSIKLVPDLIDLIKKAGQNPSEDLLSLERLSKKFVGASSNSGGGNSYNKPRPSYNSNDSYSNKSFKHNSDNEFKRVGDSGFKRSYDKDNEGDYEQKYDRKPNPERMRDRPSKHSFERNSYSGGYSKGKNYDE
eukprot:TRINITY_DN251_c0_g1_i1.p1 TRINITY_DN251_c0_g1~~TRINITY_DN251_c0_g1_i1.p1  ORF type:complete len:623 (+),score=135.93 TRINITY_DN251_c0_g1_i1:297-2165(+)